VVSERTVRAHLRRKGLDRASRGSQPTQVLGRYEAERPNQRWIGDVLTGPYVPCPRVAGSQRAKLRAKLFVLVDDHSRLLVPGRWIAEENTRAGQDTLRQAIVQAIVRRGLPEALYEALYVDNGAPYANAALDRCCAVLGIRLVHSQPDRPQGRGKQERLNRVIRERFLLEATHTGIASLADHWPSSTTASTTASTPGPSRCSTPASTPRPARPPWPGGRPAGHHGPPTPSCWRRRFAGRWSAGSPRPPPSA